MTNTTASQTWIVKIGDDDPFVSRHNDITNAEMVASDRSQHSWNRTAYVCRVGGQRIREYADGVLVGYLGGDEKWVTR